MLTWSGAVNSICSRMLAGVSAAHAGMCVPCRAVLGMLKTGLRPKDIMTKAAFTNALTLVMATGGSTNAVLHFLAIARAVGVPLTLNDFQVGPCLGMLTSIFSDC